MYRQTILMDKDIYGQTEREKRLTEIKTKETNQIRWRERDGGRRKGGIMCAFEFSIIHHMHLNIFFFE
jgi:hypothetical protein